MNLTVTRVSDKKKEYKGQKKFGILTREFGDTWLNGLSYNDIKAGDVIVAEVKDTEWGKQFEITGKPSTSSSVLGNKLVKEDESTKDKQIKWLNALNNACLLASTGKIELTAIKATAEKIYQMHPIGTPENKAVELPVIQHDEWIPEENNPDIW